MILLIDKPTGITSFDVIRRLRKKLNIKKMGHSGTLDPLATGLLIIATEQDTKKLTELIGLPKTYEAEILLGTKTTTGDIGGEVLEEKGVSHLSDEDIRSAVKEMTGALELPVPAYSAIKQNGQPLYKKARKGEVVEVPIKQMNVREAKVLSIDLPCATVQYDVSSGTYIRSLAEELGQRLGVGGTISKLRRTRIGDFFVDDAEVI